MALSLKNPETEQLAKELARQTGESITTAVTIALRERLEREEKARKREGRLEWLDRITKETSAIMNNGKTYEEIMDEMYDSETGLPR
ncbi:MAG TPA: type II toxin-antitoxin system VapB family antitoxin [Terracidiphilus sp.]|nr:type II toxin-antitoxin system VapB family antitoxin [Terracidiphilus sp.]